MTLVPATSVLPRLVTANVQVLADKAAYDAGYEDASNLGPDGFSVVPEWDQVRREHYIRGFNGGLRAHALRLRRDRSNSIR